MIKWNMQIEDKSAEINCSDKFTVEELEVVKALLEKMIDARIVELKSYRANSLPLTADIDSMYPELSVRARNILKRAGCNTIDDVLNCTLTDIKRMRNMGKNTFEEIVTRFSKYGSFREGTEGVNE